MTRTAPEEMSWSCQPVSFPGDQQMSQTSRYSSRWIEAQWRCMAEEQAIWSVHSSGRAASCSTSSASSVWSRYRAGSEVMLTAVAPFCCRAVKTVSSGGSWSSVEQPGRVCDADRMARCLAEATIGAGLRVRPVRAVYHHVDAEHAEYGIYATHPLTGRFDVSARIDRA